MKPLTLALLILSGLMFSGCGKDDVRRETVKRQNADFEWKVDAKSQAAYDDLVRGK